VSAPSGLRYDRYRVNGQPEWLMRIGPEDGLPILFLPALFEETNRIRALVAGVMRLLGGEGFCCTLPDLPGTGESERALDACTWDDWRTAVQAIARPALIASFRGGALLDAVEAAAWWRFAPVSGASLMRDVDRSALAGGGGDAGYPISASLADAIRGTEPAPLAPCRTVRLASDPRPADVKLAGPALWRRSEPSTSSELTLLIASDISAWVRSCAAF
jgi:hypothetical protein